MTHNEKPYRCTTPVAFLVFNRPETTRRVFAEIARAQPPKLLIVADGARTDRPGEAERCAEVRRIVERIDWNCTVLTNYSETNQGCARRVASGIDWVFENTEEAIFLEDDCLPHPAFFRFCGEMLAAYRDDERIMSIGGSNFQFGANQSAYSYYFSRYVHVWGWASWRRAWQHYDAAMSGWPSAREQGWLNTILEDRREARYWTSIFDRVFSGQIGTWDYQWMYACWQQSALAVIPGVNLISNIGFGSDATHTDGGRGKLADMAVEAITFPLLQPPAVTRNSQADFSTGRRFFRPSVFGPIRQSIRQFLG